MDKNTHRWFSRPQGKKRPENQVSGFLGGGAREQFKYPLGLILSISGHKVIIWQTFEMQQGLERDCGGSLDGASTEYSRLSGYVDARGLG